MLIFSTLHKLKNLGFPFKEVDAFTSQDKETFFIAGDGYEMPVESDFFRELMYSTFQLHCFQNGTYFCARESDLPAQIFYDTALAALANYYIKTNET